MCKHSRNRQSRRNHLETWGLTYAAVAWPALEVLPCERANRSVHSPQQSGIFAMKETAGAQSLSSTLLTSAAIYFSSGVSFIYFCFSNNSVETLCPLNCLLIILGTWAYQCFICNSRAMLIKYLKQTLLLYIYIYIYIWKSSQPIALLLSPWHQKSPLLQCCSFKILLLNLKNCY